MFKQWDGVSLLVPQWQGIIWVELGLLSQTCFVGFHGQPTCPKVIHIVATRPLRPAKWSMVMANRRPGWQLDFTSVFRRSDSHYYLSIYSLYTYAAVTCHEPEPAFDFALLIEAMLLKGAQCKPIEEAFAILGTPLISCEGNVCSFHCLSGLHHGAKEGVDIFIQFFNNFKNIYFLTK